MIKDENKEYLSTILQDLADAFLYCGEDEWQDKASNENRGNYHKYTITDKYKIELSFFNGESEISISTNVWDPRPLFYLMQYLDANEPNVKFSNSAYFDLFYGDLTLYFKSDPESFKAFKDGIRLDGVKLELEAREQEQPSVQNTNDGNSGQNDDLDR